jgi:hypothetical protein
MQSSGPASDPASEPNVLDAAPAPLARSAFNAAPSAALEARAASTIVALSDDPILLEALEGAARAHAAVIISPSADRFVDQLVANAASVALIDASSVPPPLKPFIALLREQFPHLLLIVAGPAQLQHQFTAQIDDGTIFRFVHKPASSQRLKLFIDAALRSQQAAPKAAGSFASYITTPAPAHSSTRRVVLAVLSMAVVAAIVAAWRVSVPNSATSTPLAAATPATVAPVLDPVEATVHHLAPSSTPASERSVPRITAIPEAPAAPAALLDPSAAQLASALQSAHQRVADGALIDPPGDSARAYLDEAMALAPNDAQVRELSIALGEALIAKFRRAASAGDTTAAQLWLQACSDYKINPATLSALTAQLAQLEASAPGGSDAPPTHNP